jgi:hypothetical protein
MPSSESSDISHPALLLASWEKFRRFEALVLEPGGSLAAFLTEWEERLAGAMQAGCLYSDTVLAFKLLTGAQLSEEAAAEVLSELKTGGSSEEDSSLVSQVASLLQEEGRFRPAEGGGLSKCANEIARTKSKLIQIGVRYPYFTKIGTGIQVLCAQVILNPFTNKRVQQNLNFLQWYNYRYRYQHKRRRCLRIDTGTYWHYLCDRYVPVPVIPVPVHRYLIPVPVIKVA